jgi:hypothetical protein
MIQALQSIDQTGRMNTMKVHAYRTTHESKVHPISLSHVSPPRYNLRCIEEKQQPISPQVLDTFERSVGAALCPSQCSHTSILLELPTKPRKAISSYP